MTQSVLLSFGKWSCSWVSCFMLKREKCVSFIFCCCVTGDQELNEKFLVENFSTASNHFACSSLSLSLQLFLFLSIYLSLYIFHPSLFPSSSLFIESFILSSPLCISILAIQFFFICLFPMSSASLLNSSCQCESLPLLIRLTFIYFSFSFNLSLNFFALLKYLFHEAFQEFFLHITHSLSLPVFLCLTIFYQDWCQKPNSLSSFSSLSFLSPSISPADSSCCFKMSW